MFHPFLRASQKFSILKRSITRSTSGAQVLSSNEIRQQFLDFFVRDHNHKFVRSSPVIPFSDPTIAFVNAGMNQFKNVFLGTTQAPCKRAVNSQKCVRVGGKHNDINIVGSDGYHHTFFEMLGNWSFGDYFKREACEMAWCLLIEGYKVDVRRIYVTYFGGDKELGLPPDLECREIWLSLGVSPDRVLPFGAKDNFWEMGSSGPCGPCTEIHVDHSDQYMNTANRKLLVNAGFPDLTEIWNIVFIQYNRNINDGSISNLPQHHVDTGLGLERLVAHLQKASSNYDTDLFRPLITQIQKVSKKDVYQGTFNDSQKQFELDTAYRIIADHSRMITACLSDGMFPSQSHKLRRILRRAFAISDRFFSCPKMMHELVPVVVQILGPTYPEMESKFLDTLQIIDHEEEIYRQLCSTLSSDGRIILKETPYLEEIDLVDHPGLPYALKEIQRLKNSIKVMNGEMIHKMYDTYGLNEDLLLKIAENEKIDVDLSGYEAFSHNLKDGAKFELASRLQENLVKAASLNERFNNSQICPTRNEYKYNYGYNKDKQLYEIPNVKTKIVSIITLGAESDACHIITEKSNFYFESGGQQGDKGYMWLAKDPSQKFTVSVVGEHQGYVMHSVDSCAASKLLLGDEVILVVDSSHRSSNIIHHTATHLLNAVARKVLQVPLCQRSSFVGDKRLKLELAVYGAKIGPDQVEELEQQIRNIISQDEIINVRNCNIGDVDLNQVVKIPGEVYPEQGLRLVTIGSNISVEFCCGTHAQSTGELLDFCITCVVQTKPGCYTFHAIAGQAAQKAHQLGEQIDNDVHQLKHDLDQQMVEDVTNIDARMQRLKNVLLLGSENNIHLPYAIRQRCLDIINGLYKRLKNHTRESLREFIDIEMKNLRMEKPLAKHPFIVHFLESSVILEEVQLSKATKYFPDRPILVISITDDQVKARATVPVKYITDSFNAQKWLKIVGSLFKANVAAPKGQNIAEVCNMRSRKVKSLQFETLLDRALKEAKQFAKQNMQ